MPAFIESEKLLVIGNGPRVIHCWEVGLHMDDKFQGILTVIGNANEKDFHTWDIMHIFASHSNNKLNSSFEPNVVETNNSLYPVSQCHLIVLFSST